MKTGEMFGGRFRAGGIHTSGNVPLRNILGHSVAKAVPIEVKDPKQD